ncbi:MAG: hypothetical protein HC772_17515, partial [Leptolyngbyaceae cyanobacterium CRU_2_3]|nr:hypothetical protein [Leptolyngbyaceae cyanobacterium CRU_2_3]
VSHGRTCYRNARTPFRFAPFNITRSENDWDNQLSNRLVEQLESELGNAFAEIDSAINREKLLEQQLRELGVEPWAIPQEEGDRAMTNSQNFEHRLDQVETIAAILVTHVEAIDSRLERIAANQEQSDRRLDGLTSNVDALAALMAQQFQQAEQDRIEFRATVQGILDVLTQRFNSNGHS